MAKYLSSWAANAGGSPANKGWGTPRSTLKKEINKSQIHGGGE
jgi:hypothetical protein